MIHRWTMGGFGLLLVSTAAIAAIPPSDTVNSFTPDQERQARQAATQAGYQVTALGFAQAGNFFFTAKKDGQTYELTVTPDQNVYASTLEGQGAP